MLPPRGRLLSGARQRAGLIAEPGEQTVDRDVFVQRLPVQTAAADAASLALFAAGAQQLRKLRERHPDDAPIGQRHPEIVVMEADGGRSDQRNSATPSRCASMVRPCQATDALSCAGVKLILKFGADPTLMRWAR